MSRRAADALVTEGNVEVNGRLVGIGTEVGEKDRIIVNGQEINLDANHTIVLLDKPAGYVCSRRGQGSKTIYDLLPVKYHALKPVGRLDKDSSGLLLLTDDGSLANRLTHPRYQKTKVYCAGLDRPLREADKAKITKGVQLDDGTSKLSLKPLDGTGKSWQIRMQEGRNRQIRRTFAALGYQITTLHRTDFGPYSLQQLHSGKRYYEVSAK